MRRVIVGISRYMQHCSNSHVVEQNLRPCLALSSTNWQSVAGWASQIGGPQCAETGHALLLIRIRQVGILRCGLASKYVPGHVNQPKIDVCSSAFSYGSLGWPSSTIANMLSIFFEWPNPKLAGFCATRARPHQRQMKRSQQKIVGDTYNRQIWRNG
ncbi:hypothetical protein CI102_9655 [Trichoderma harzianum]|nr:hypothetical protein CI102_9655 [Trichoderma harzianum]